MALVELDGLVSFVQPNYYLTENRNLGQDTLFLPICLFKWQNPLSNDSLLSMPRFLKRKKNIALIHLYLGRLGSFAT